MQLHMHSLAKTSSKGPASHQALCCVLMCFVRVFFGYPAFRSLALLVRWLRVVGLFTHSSATMNHFHRVQSISRVFVL
jgi:hypothetical protein